MCRATPSRKKNIMKYYFKENVKFKFLNLKVETLNKLRELKTERLFISNSTIEKITSILEIDKLSDEDLTACRNTIVDKIATQEEDSYLKMSMIVTVIDNEKLNRNLKI